MSRRKGKGAAAAAEHGLSERTKDALAAKKAQGVKLGGLTPEVLPSETPRSNARGRWHRSSMSLMVSRLARSRAS
jgi:hypothetical protein